jgi:hypothetical protein
MKPSHQTLTHLYEHLGKVFYCVAAVDTIVRKEEIEQLKQILKTEWLPLENTFNEFGDDAAYEIEIVFDWLLANKWNFEQALPELKTFKKEHPSLFSPQLNALILKTAKTIATSFSGKNKSERTMLIQLSAILSDS